MKHEFDMTDLDKMRYFLSGVFINKKKYALEVRQRFGMEKSNLAHNVMVPYCKLVKNEGGVKVDRTHFKCIVEVLCVSPPLNQM